MNGVARVLAVVCLAGLVGCGPAAQPTSPTEPSIAEAERFLGQLVALARQGNFDGLCATAGDLNCKPKLDAAGRDNVPIDPPTVVAARVIPTTAAGGQVTQGGIVLELCGTTRAGAAYNSEILVFRDGATLRAINPVYWGTTKIASGRGTPASPAPIGHC